MSHRASASGFHVNVAVVTEFFDLAHSLTVWCGFVLGKRLKRHLDQGKQLSVFDFHLVGTHNLTTVFRSRLGERIGNPGPTRWLDLDATFRPICAFRFALAEKQRI